MWVAAGARAGGAPGRARPDKCRAVAGERKQVGQGGDGNDRQALFRCHRLCGGTGVVFLHAFLSIERDHYPGRDAATLADDRQCLADRGAGGDHVIDDQHAPALQRRADQAAALAVRLGFLAVECQRQVAAAARVLAGQRGRQRDALVGRAEQQVEVQACRFDRVGVAAGEFRECDAGVEAPGIEEIRAVASRFQRELAEAQCLRLQCE